MRPVVAGPIPAVNHPLIGEQDITALKRKSSLRPEYPAGSTAWQRHYVAARITRWSERRRISLAPQKDCEVKLLAELAKCLQKLEAIQKEFTLTVWGRRFRADLIFLGGCAAVERASKGAGSMESPFTRGAWPSQEHTDVESSNRPRMDSQLSLATGVCLLDEEQ